MQSGFHTGKRGSRMLWKQNVQSTESQAPRKGMHWALHPVWGWNREKTWEKSHLTQAGGIQAEASDFPLETPEKELFHWLRV